jgi:hypothetical protein
MTRRRMLIEWAAVLAVFTAAIATLPTFFDASTLWTKRFWLDEQCCTLYAVYDAASFFDLFGTVKRSEVGPPLLHMIVWTVGKVTGSLSPTVVRSIMLVTIVAALLLLWIVLRRRFAVTSTAAAVTAVAGHGLVLQHAFDGRFYGPWLFFAVGYVWALGVEADKPRSARRDAAVALFSLFLCTIHWFGVISLGLMAAGAVVAHGRRWKQGVRLVAPGVVGLVALAALIPMMLFQLRTGGEDILWVPPLNMAQVKVFTQAFVVRLPIVIALVLLLVAALRPHHQRPAVMSVLRDPPMAAMLATGLMTLALIVISAVLNSVMVPRYAISSVLLAAPIVALAAETLKPYLRVLLTAVFVLLLVRRMEREIVNARFFAQTTDLYAELVAQLKPQNAPIVFQSYFMMYPVDGQARRNSVIRVLDLPDSTIRSIFPASPDYEPRIAKMRLDRNQARLHHRGFGFPIPATKAQLDTTKRFYMMGPEMQELGQILFPNHRHARLHELVTVFERP